MLHSRQRVAASFSVPLAGLPRAAEPAQGRGHRSERQAPCRQPLLQPLWNLLVAHGRWACVSTVPVQTAVSLASQQTASRHCSLSHSAAPAGWPASSTSSSRAPCPMTPSSLTAPSSPWASSRFVPSLSASCLCKRTLCMTPHSLQLSRSHVFWLPAGPHRGEEGPGPGPGRRAGAVRPAHQDGVHRPEPAHPQELGRLRAPHAPRAPGSPAAAAATCRPATATAQQQRPLSSRLCSAATPQAPRSLPD